MDVNALVVQEMQAINNTLCSFKIRARIPSNGIRVCGSAFINYTLEFAAGTSVKDVTTHLQDIEVAVTRLRKRNTKVRFSEPMYLVIDHPDPKGLPYDPAILRGKPLHMLVGRDYSVSPAVDDLVSLAKTPHTLVAGITGSGKSTLVRSMLGTLLYNTSPEHLIVYLVDLKGGETLSAFSELPHVADYTTDAPDRIFTSVNMILDQRKKILRMTDEPYVLLLVEEFAGLDKDHLDLLPMIMTQGRSKRVNVLATIQKPTVAAMGSMVKANFSTRLVGRVSDARESVTATGQSDLHAELLRGHGLFLRIEGDVRRLQVYNFNEDAIDLVVAKTAYRWQDVDSLLVTQVVSTPVLTPVLEPILVQNWPIKAENASNTGATPVLTPPVAPATPRTLETNFPIKDRRELTRDEALAVKRMLEAGHSQNKICDVVFGIGGKNKERVERVKRALERL